eukprot:1885360-Rhodomonas_salina.3
MSVPVGNCRGVPDDKPCHYRTWRRTVVGEYRQYRTWRRAVVGEYRTMRAKASAVSKPCASSRSPGTTGPYISTSVSHSMSVQYPRSVPAFVAAYTRLVPVFIAGYTRSVPVYTRLIGLLVAQCPGIVWYESEPCRKVGIFGTRVRHVGK